jgi:16S rRNA (uracil1498-N3)-methyltransferase
MALPFFYLSSYEPGAGEITLDEDNSRHIIQVLRMRTGEDLQLTDGKGTLLTATIIDDHKKKCRVKVKTTVLHPPAGRSVTIAISLLKNASRFEWFLEKAAEIGVTGIVPLWCERTERHQVRQDRLHNILVSALLQSQQTRMPLLREPAPFAQWILEARQDQRFIAHCLEDTRPGAFLMDAVRADVSKDPETSRIILIGPEGDFSPKEVEMALQHKFLPVSLGENRLRTETAGIVAATLLCIG